MFVVILKCYVVIGCVCVNNWNRYWNVKMVYYKNDFLFN